MFHNTLFELAEMFRKIIRVFQTILIYFMYNEEQFSDEAKNQSIFKILSGIFSLFFDLDTPYN
jgi:hypothetical protein